MIVQNGSTNLTALVVPDVVVNILPDSVASLNGVPTGRLGIAGSAPYGPVGVPMVIGDYSNDYVSTFGTLQANTHDAGTYVAIGAQNGVQDFRVIRVTDGSDTHATGAPAVANSGLFTSIYTGSGADQITVGFSTGSKAGTIRTVVARSTNSEIYDNLPTSGFWPALANAVLSSNLVNYTIGNTAAAAPSLNTSFALSGGTDGALNVNSATVAAAINLFDGLGCSIIAPADVSDPAQWANLETFGVSEGAYIIVAGQPGETITNAVANRTLAGCDSPAIKILLNDALYWSDPVNQTTRLVSQAAFSAARLANLSPEQSSLNKQVYGIVGSQRVGLVGNRSAGKFSKAELTQLIQGGLDLISTPSKGGAYWSAQNGRNTSSNANTNDDSWTRLTNYMAATLNAGLGVYDGAQISPDMLRSVKATLVNFLNGMKNAGMLVLNSDGSLPFNVVCDASNNPQSQTAQGYVVANVSVTYAGITRYLIVNLDAGAGVVTITPAS